MVLHFLNKVSIRRHRLYGEVSYYNSHFVREKGISTKSYEHSAANQRVNIQPEKPLFSLRDNRSYVQVVVSNKQTGMVNLEGSTSKQHNAIGDLNVSKLHKDQVEYWIWDNAMLGWTILTGLLDHVWEFLEIFSSYFPLKG